MELVKVDIYTTKHVVTHISIGKCFHYIHLLILPGSWLENSFISSSFRLMMDARSKPTQILSILLKLTSKCVLLKKYIINV